jgi:hypothetical protein
MADLDKWMEIARQNFSDNQLHIWLKANKAFQAFQVRLDSDMISMGI